MTNLDAIELGDYPIEVVDEGSDCVLIFDNPAIFAEFERAELAGTSFDLDVKGVRQRLLSLQDLLHQTLNLLP